MRATDVFINCPFDKQYLPILHAVTFAVQEAGFRARTALETSDSGPSRLERIVGLINECKYGIHDISRVTTGTKGTPDMPRFNMPFECGLFYGARYLGGRTHGKKEVLILDSIKYRFQQTLSDIAGQDASAHEDDPHKAIECVRRFLNGKEQGALPGATAIKRRYEEFRAVLPKVARRHNFTVRELTEDLSYWPDLLNVMGEWQRL